MSKSTFNKTTKYFLDIVNVLLLALTILGVIKSWFVGFDIDEAYAVAQSYRMVMGDNMFSQMWESHQMSAFGVAVLMLPYLLFTGGQTTGIVLYLRIVGSVIHLLLGWWFFDKAQKKFGLTAGLLIMFAHVNFLPKWVTLAEFELMQYWAVCILFLALLTWHEKAQAILRLVPDNQTTADVQKVKFFQWRKEDKWLILSGAALFMAMMTYPTMILLYPVYAVALLVIKGRSTREKWRSVLIFTGTVFVIGVAFLIYLRTYMTVDDFIKYVSYIFMDESHSISLSQRVANYGQELLHFIKQMFLYSPAALVATALIWGGEFACRKKVVSNRKKSQKGDVAKVGLKGVLCRYVLIFFLFWLGIYVGKHILLSIFADKNQFFLYFRYMVAVLVAMVGFIMCIRKNNAYFWFGVLPGIMGVIASALVTNMSLEVAMARIYIGVMSGFFILCSLIKEKYDEDIVVKAVGYAVTVSFIIGLVICKLVLVRVTGCMPVTIRMDMAWVKEGPAAGLLVQEELAKQYNENIPLIEKHVDEKDALLYFGCENIYYMVAGADLATPSVQGTAVFNEMFLKYYKEYPEREPDVVIIDKGFATNPVYNYSEQNQVMLDWIDEEFMGYKREETEYFIIIKK